MRDDSSHGALHALHALDALGWASSGSRCCRCVHIPPPPDCSAFSIQRGTPPSITSPPALSGVYYSCRCNTTGRSSSRYYHAFIVPLNLLFFQLVLNVLLKQLANDNTMDSAAPDHSLVPSHAAGDNSKIKSDIPAVRFASATEEISPSATATAPKQDDDFSFSEVAADQLRAFTNSLHGRHLQERRMNTYNYEAFSLPPSRVSRW